MIRFTSITRQADDTWLFTWTATGATYYRVVLQGRQLALVTTPSYNQRSQAEFPGPLEVVEEEELALSEQYSPFRVLQWYTALTPALYQIDEFVNSAWIKRQKIVESDQWVYQYRSGTLLDNSFHTWRVRSGDQLGQYSSSLVFDDLVVCPPAFDEALHGVGWDKPNLSLVVS